MKTSLRSRWMRLSILIIIGSFIMFSAFLIYATSLYLKDLQYRALDRSAVELKAMYETTAFNTIDEREIYSNLYDNQKFVLYTNSGEEVYRWPSRDMSFNIPREQIIHPDIYSLDFEDMSYLVQTVKIDSEYWNGYIAVVHPMNEYYTILQMIIIIATIIGFMSISITLVISYFMAGQMVRPIYRFTRQLQYVENNGFSERLDLKTNLEEIDYMVLSFNKMMDTLEESFNQQKQFVEDASHELRTPLQIVQGHLNLINRWGKNDKAVLEESLQISIDEMGRITKLIEELLELTKNENEKTNIIEPINLNEEIISRVNAMKQLHPAYTFTLDLDQAIFYPISQYQFEQILVIFLDNAVKYDYINKSIHIKSKLMSNKIKIEISDKGVGIPKEDVNKVFDRFYRVDKSRSRELGGNGLGLSIAKKIIESNDGNVYLESKINEGTTIHIEFPLK